MHVGALQREWVASAAGAVVAADPGAETAELMRYRLPHDPPSTSSRRIATAAYDRSHPLAVGRI